MSYFDNANNRVTRKSFGSKIDKEFKREGVIPVKDRKKVDSLAESAAKYEELNKKVNERRLQDLKDRKAYDTKIQEGYKSLKEELIKDIISEICVESILVDEEVVTENLKNIVEMVEMKVDDIGGFEGVKKIAESTRNPILLNMISLCENTAKKVGERNIKEGNQNKEKVNFGLNKIELEEFDYRKKEIGTETIVNNIKEKVFQVVQDEQKLSSDKEMVMNDIQNKVSELEAPVEEAMSFIFNKPGIEEDTLFNSLMRRQYKQLLESNSSAIFESFDYKDDLETLFEDSEFEMDDISMDDLDIDDEDEIQNMFLNEAKVLEDIDDEDYENALENYFKLIVEGSENLRSRAHAKHFKSVVRNLQENLELIEEKYVHNIQKHARKISDKKLDKSINKWEQEVEATRNKIKGEKDKVKIEDYREDLRTLEAELKALKAEKSHRGSQLKIAKQANPYMKSTMESVEDVRNRLNSLTNDHTEFESIEEGFLSKIKDKLIKPKDPFNMTYKELKAKVDNAKKAYQQAITDGTVDIDEPQQVFRYSAEILNERNRVKNVIDVMENDKNCDGEKLWIMKHYYEWLQAFEDNMIDRMVKYIKKDIVESKSKLTKSFNNCKEPAQYREFITAVTYLIKYYRDLAALVNIPEVDAHCKWLEMMHGKACDKAGIGDGPLVFESKETSKAVDKEVKALNKEVDGAVHDVEEEVILCPKCGKEECSCKVAKESSLIEEYIEKLDNICESLSTIVEAHEEAKTNVIESLTKEINGEITLVPYLQTRDVNSNNLEFIYRTKIVCETLKNNLKYVDNVQEAATMIKAVDLNIASINETLEVIKDREDMAYKTKVLNMGKAYLGKVKAVLESKEYSDEIIESGNVFSTPEDVERIFEQVREYYVIESTDKDLMELVMAEAIVEYTILETFNTLHLMKFTKDSVRQMARKNIN